MAFLQYLESVTKISKDIKINIAGDYRDNTDHIIKVIIKAIIDRGYMVEYCGKIPTPALAYYCMLNNAPGIMVTGSHIPADMNGIKFYKGEGEITKADEKSILEQTFTIDGSIFDEAGVMQHEYLYTAPLSFSAYDGYLNRYLQFYPPLILEGLRIGVYKHSSVAGTILSELLRRLGAEVMVFGATEHFYSLDTESLNDNDIRIVKENLHSERLDAVISTDGDADRPLLTDENGVWLRGDMIGMLCALILDAEYVVTPISSNSSVERIEKFKAVIRTKIGSPYVIEAIDKLRHENKRDIVGYEANGGVLIGSDFLRNDKILMALPTRDSVIAILSILTYINKNKVKISELINKYSLSFTESSSLKISSEKISDFFALILESGNIESNLQHIFKLNQQIKSIDLTDGVRALLEDDSIIHLRASGNSPELRCYTESASKKQALILNQHCMNIIEHWRQENDRQK
jgi:phosphomannomutase